MKHFRLIIITLLLLAVLPLAKAQRFGGGLMLGPALSTMNISGNDSTRFRPDFTGGVRIALIPERRNRCALFAARHELEKVVWRKQHHLYTLFGKVALHQRAVTA